MTVIQIIAGVIVGACIVFIILAAIKMLKGLGKKW